MPKQKPFDYRADIGGGKKHRKVGKTKKHRKMYFQAPMRKHTKKKSRKR